MKQLIIVLTTITLLFSCNENNRVDYEINGTAKDVYNGIRVYLKQLDDKGKEVIIDTAIVMNEQFKINGSVKSPDIYFISVNSVKGRVPFMLENSKIDIEIDKNNITESTILGSNSHKGFVAYQDGIKAIAEQRKIISNKYQSFNLTKDAMLKDSMSKLLDGFNTKLQSYPLRFIENNKDEYFSLSIIELQSRKKDFDVKNYLNVFDNLDEKLKTSNKGIEVKEKLDELMATYEKNAYLEIGNIAPNFEAPTSNGDMVSLNAIMGKVTIIDFWAAWCGPCRRENPNVVKIYNTYHDQGLEIIGVSLDGNPRQKDSKKAWLDAIAADGLEWHHVSNLNYFNCPVAKQYNISSIPATYILDKDGKIVAKNLRGKALEDKVKELLAEYDSSTL